jgi:DNA-binding transcriptional MerR regulator
METNTQIPDKIYFRIGDVAELAGVKPYVLRYWETEFPVIAPEKSNTGQRVYRRADVETVLVIKHLLYNERYSIEGARKRLKDLRKDGDFKAFKTGVLHAKTESAESVSVHRDRVKQIKSLARELSSLAQIPVGQFFKY